MRSSWIVQESRVFFISEGTMFHIFGPRYLSALKPQSVCERRLYWILLCSNMYYVLFMYYWSSQIVANILRFFTWIVKESSFCINFSNVNTLSLSTVPGARSFKWFIRLSDVLWQLIHTKGQYANWDSIKDFIKAMRRLRLMHL